MKLLKLGILLTVFALSLAACSSTTDQPAADAKADAPAGGNSIAPAASAPKPAAPAAPKMVTVPAGTEIEIVLTDGLSSAKNKSGDTFAGSLAAALVVGGTTVLEKGATVHGRVVDAKGSARVKGLASMSLALTDIVQSGKTVSVSTKDWVKEAEATKKKDTGIIGGAAGIGAAIGAIAGGKKGAAEGAAIGGGAGAGTVLATKGKEVELAPETKVTFTLEKSVELAAKKG
ncbi:MAG TPA: hypothetical protein VK210_17640 [Terriglobia bacterium]|nr:hypothetical protein [Terriglobia bacterium]